MKKQKYETKLFDPIKYLDNEETISEYLKLALQSGDIDLLKSALSDVERAKHMLSDGIQFEKGAT